MGSSLEGVARRLKEAVVPWYRQHGDRELPWRVAESWWAKLVGVFLLRRTSVRQVLEVYQDLLRMLPDPRSALEIPLEELEKALRRLGLHKQRARQLKRLAELVVSRYGGSLPCRYEELVSLPGLGEYSASELMVAVCGEPRPMIDTNVVRVLGRALGLRVGPQPYRDPVLVALLRAATPEAPREALEFYYGLMDLARKVCHPRAPLCERCPLEGFCAYRRRGAAGLPQ